ncbi:hypothetical protein [Sphingobacterium detergens]|uniref:Uncharacterized protein n=1 Tax=Sphingobacterium detergens TaxID=1145106 RepID=A0A420B6H0_SPHD1|nr:hypothetical protein [Sphingobacterium detergens]RKE52380.1 hypothetical protein DFQ12_2616 [Sphingobacterium detergens]
MNIDKSNLEFRNKLADELSSLKIALNKVNIEKKSLDSIDRAVKTLRDVKHLPSFVDESKKELPEISTPYSWGYAIKNFTLFVDTSSSIQYPKSVKKATLQFSVDVVGEFDKSGHEFIDPFKRLEFNVVIEGFSRGMKQHIFTYHLDRDLKGANPSNEVHPSYHFHYGGRKLGAYTDKNFGNSLILDMPRLMHYPMDFILGLDFVMSNFTPDLWRQLKREPIYIKLIRQAQDRIMKPYFGALAQHFGFHNKIAGTWPGSKILPQVI